jgi:protein-tyrosine phosphatase
MGAGLLTRMLPDVEVTSAGLDALDGCPADPTVVDLMSRIGVDISAHKSRRINGHIVANADLILAMDVNQKQHVERRYVAARGRVFRVCESAGMDVNDPYLLGPHHYARVMEQLIEGMSAWATKIGLLERWGAKVHG